VGTYCISGCSAVYHCVDGTDFVSLDALLFHFSLDQFLIGQEVDAIADSFTEDSDPLAFINPGYPMF
jgi:hypothetical protein